MKYFLFLFITLLKISSLICFEIIIVNEPFYANEAVRKFTGRSYTEISKKNDGNFVFNPFSVDLILALLAEGTKGHTREELVHDGFISRNKMENRAAVQYFSSKIAKGYNKTTYSNAIKLFVRSDVRINKKFEYIAKNLYKADIQHVNIKNRNGTANILKNWTNTIFGKKFTISPKDITNKSNLILVNAVGLKAVWYHSHDILPLMFFNDEFNPVEVTSLFNTDLYRYYENEELEATFLEIPLKTLRDESSPNFKMVVILPNPMDSLSYLEENVERLFEPQPYRLEEVQMQLPVFSTETITDFKSILSNMKITDLFDGRSADFSGISYFNTKRYHVAQMKQQVVFDVGVFGIKGKSYVKDDLTTRGVHFKFIVNRPFMYYIHMDGLIVFAGRVTNM